MIVPSQICVTRASHDLSRVLLNVQVNGIQVWVCLCARQITKNIFRSSDDPCWYQMMLYCIMIPSYDMWYQMMPNDSCLLVFWYHFASWCPIVFEDYAFFLLFHINPLCIKTWLDLWGWYNAMMLWYYVLTAWYQILLPNDDKFDAKWCHMMPNDAEWHQIMPNDVEWHQIMTFSVA